MLWPDEIRAADFASLDDDAHATAKELEMANMLVESLAGDYDPDEYEDDYALAVDALVKAKLEGGEVRQAPERKEETGEVVDLLAALAKSVEKAKASRGEAPAATEEGGEKPAKKAAPKAAAKKTAAKRTAPAKKTAAKKTAAKKTAKKAS
jgi:DNA end-binding protein Ku